MKKISGFVVVVAACFAFSGSVIADELVIVGTGSGSSVLKEVGQAFTMTTPGTVIFVPKSIGSGGGIKAVGNDKYLVGRTARTLKDREKPFGLTYLEYAQLPIVFMVNHRVTVNDLSQQQVCDIYSGKIKNWRDVGGKKGKIRVIRREEGDSSLSILLKTMPCFKNIKITTRSKTTFSDPSTIETA